MSCKMKKFFFVSSLFIICHTQSFAQEISLNHETAVASTESISSKTITPQDVAGIYQFNEFTTSANMPPANAAQAFASVGQLSFRADGTGTWLAFSTGIIINGVYTYFDVPSFEFVYTLDPVVNGLAMMDFNFPDFGPASTKVSFKMHGGKVTGGSMIHITLPAAISAVSALVNFERFD